MNIFKKIVILFSIFLSSFAFADNYDNALKAYYKEDYALSMALLKKVDFKRNPEANVLKGLIYFKQDKIDLGLASLNKYGEIPEELKPWFSYLKLKKFSIDGDEKKLLDELNYITQVHSQSFIVKKSRFILAEYYFKRGDFKRARQMLLVYLSDEKDPVYKEALKLFIEIEMALKNDNSVIKYYGELIKRFPAEDSNRELLKRIQLFLGYNLSLGQTLPTFEDKYMHMKSLLSVQDLSGVIQHGEQMAEQYKKHPRLVEIYFLIGRAYFNKGLFGKAAANFDVALNTGIVPDHLQIEIHYYMAQSLIRANQYDKAIDHLLFITKSPKKSFLKEQAYFHLTDLYSKVGTYEEFKNAQDMYQKLYGSKLSFKRVNWDAHWRSFADSKSPIVNQHFEKLKDITNDSLATRLKRFYQKNSKTTEDILSKFKQLPVSFFTYQALTRFFRTEISTFTSEEQQNYDTALTLYNMGFGALVEEEALYQVKYNKKNKEVYLKVLIHLYNKIDNTHEMVMVLRRHLAGYQLKYGEIDSWMLKLLYPRPYWDWVKKYSTKYHVDPYLVLAIMREESFFKPTAKSVSNAHGLMQIMPATGKDIAYRLGKHWYGPDDLLDPEKNIQFGAYYLGWLSKMFDGTLHYIVTGYNAGPGTTRRWRTEFGSDSLIKYVDKVPFPETSDYLQRVADSYLIYNLIYN